MMKTQHSSQRCSATLALALALTGCAAQAQVGMQSTKLTAGGNEFVSIAGVDETIQTTGFALYDSTGILLAALTNAGQVHQERQKAAAQAAAAGRDSFTFSVDMVAPTPGLWTKFEYIKAEGDSLKYVHKDVRMTFHTLFFGDDGQEDVRALPQLALGLGFFQSSLTTEQLGGNTEDAFALPISATYTQTIPGLKNLRVSVGAGFDLVAPVFGTLGYEATGRVDFLLFNWLSAYSALTHRRAPADTGDTTIKVNGVDVGLTAYYF